MDLEKNYKLYKKYLKAYIKRDGIENFIKWLDTTDAIEAPSSSKYVLCEPGGFIQHSLNVFNRLIKLINNEYNGFENSPYSKETIAFVALLHDVSKINFFEVCLKNVKNPVTGKWEHVPTYNIREESGRLIYGIHEENSVYMLSKFFKLSYEEALAIRWHGGCGTFNDPSSQVKMMEAYRISTLALFLYIADMQATCIDESPIKIDNLYNNKNNTEVPKNEVTNFKRDSDKIIEKEEDVPFTYSDEESTTDSYITNNKYVEDYYDEQNFEGTVEEIDDCPF